MSTKLSHGKVEPKPLIKEESLMLALENAVLALEANGMDENTIFGMVNCVLKGFIRDGKFAPEYIQHIENIIDEKKKIQAEQEEIARQEEFRQAFGGGSSLASN